MRLLFIASVVALLFALPAGAAKPSPVLTATVAGSTVTFTGSGFKPDTQYFLNVNNSSGNQVFRVGTYADSSGNLDPVEFTSASGTYSVEAFELKRGLVVAQHSSASATFTVS